MGNTRHGAGGSPPSFVAQNLRLEMGNFPSRRGVTCISQINHYEVGNFLYTLVSIMWNVYSTNNWPGSSAALKLAQNHRLEMGNNTPNTFLLFIC